VAADSSFRLPTGPRNRFGIERVQDFIELAKEAGQRGRL
jgi:hypothetical protein